MTNLQYQNVATGCVADVLEEIQSRNDLGRESAWLHRQASPHIHRRGRRDRHTVQKPQNTAGSTLTINHLDSLTSIGTTIT
jgi:hypothetical protein